MPFKKNCGGVFLGKVGKIWLFFIPTSGHTTSILSPWFCWNNFSLSLSWTNQGWWVHQQQQSIYSHTNIISQQQTFLHKESVTWIVTHFCHTKHIFLASLSLSIASKYKQHTFEHKHSTTHQRLCAYPNANLDFDLKF